MRHDKTLTTRKTCYGYRNSYYPMRKRRDEVLLSFPDLSAKYCPTSYAALYRGQISPVLSNLTGLYHGRLYRSFGGYLCPFRSGKSDRTLGWTCQAHPAIPWTFHRTFSGLATMFQLHPTDLFYKIHGYHDLFAGVALPGC